MDSPPPNQVSPPPPPPQPQVAVVGINPGTAGCLTIICAALGLPVLAYIQPGKIVRGVINQIIFFVALGFAFVIPLVIGGSISESASQAGDQDGAGAAALGGFLSAPLFMGLVWFIWIILTVIDVNKCVKNHNSGRGIKYT